MDGLFYSSNEKILFFIPANYTNGMGMLNVLNENLKEAEDIMRRFQPVGDIYATEIYVSRRYKSKWVFHTELNKCPDEAFELGEDWTISKWISN